MGVAIRRFDLKYAVAYLQNGYIERTAAKVKNQNGFTFFLIKTVGQGGRSRFIDNPQYIKTGNTARVFSGLTLCVVKIGRNGYDCIGNFLSQELAGVIGKLTQHQRRYFLRRVPPAVWPIGLPAVRYHGKR